MDLSEGDSYTSCGYGCSLHRSQLIVDRGISSPVDGILRVFQVSEEESTYGGLHLSENKMQYLFHSRTPYDHRSKSPMLHQTTA